MFIRFDMIHERDRQTDRQTDGHRMTAIAALMHSIARQNWNKITHAKSRDWWYTPVCFSIWLDSKLRNSISADRPRLHLLSVSANAANICFSCCHRWHRIFWSRNLPDGCLLWSCLSLQVYLSVSFCFWRRISNQWKVDLSFCYHHHTVYIHCVSKNRTATINVT